MFLARLGIAWSFMFDRPVPFARQIGRVCGVIKLLAYEGLNVLGHWMHRGVALLVIPLANLGGDLHRHLGYRLQRRVQPARLQV